MGKFNVPGFCANCGAVEKAHHHPSGRCPKNGVEALFGRPQRWESTRYQAVLTPEERVKEAAPKMLELLQALRTHWNVTDEPPSIDLKESVEGLLTELTVQLG